MTVNIENKKITGGGGDVVDDTTPQLGGDLDTNAKNIQFDDTKGIQDDSGNELITMSKTANAVNALTVKNAETSNPPEVQATGGDTNIDLRLTPKGSGALTVPDGTYESNVTADDDIPNKKYVDDKGINANTATELTISSGVVTKTGSSHTIDTESDASTDNLDTINGGASGDILIINANNTDRTVILKHNTGNIHTHTGNDISLIEPDVFVTLKYNGSDWEVLSQTQHNLNLRGSAPTASAVTLLWDEIPGASGVVYQIAYSQGATIDSSPILAYATGGSKTISGLPSNTQYTFSIINSSEPVSITTLEQLTTYYTYTGGVTTQTISTAGRYRIKAWGGGGGGGYYSAQDTYSGAGGYAEITLDLELGDVLRIIVGGGGGEGDWSPLAIGAGGYPHGGDGFTGDTYGGGGGGCSIVFVEDGINKRMALCAAGGAGSSGYAYYNYPGAMRGGSPNLGTSGHQGETEPRVNDTGFATSNTVDVAATPVSQWAADPLADGIVMSSSYLDYSTWNNTRVAGYRGNGISNSYSDGSGGGAGLIGGNMNGGDGRGGSGGCSGYNDNHSRFFSGGFATDNPSNHYDTYEKGSQDYINAKAANGNYSFADGVAERTNGNNGLIIKVRI